MSLVIATIPTFNEAENIGPLIAELLALGPEFEALVIDDDSPDGTWRIVQDLAAANPRVHLLHRATDRGRGLAGIAGFKEALRLGADWVVEMDADFSHHPRFIPPMLAAAREQGADLVIGSRRVAGGGEQGRSFARTIITQLASGYIRLMLGVSVKDPTSGFRVFSRRLLESLPWDAMRARGPEIVQEVLVGARARGFKMAEVPILFEDRRAGVSTFNAKIMLRSFIWMARLRLSPGPVGRPSGGRGDLDFSSWRLLRIPASWVYAVGRQLHHALYNVGLLRRRTLPKPVLCVGNLTVGGTGKTPMLIALAAELERRGRRPAILSRGYGANPPAEPPRIVSDGERILFEAAKTGDEPFLLALACPGAPVVIGTSRHAAGLLAEQNFSPDLFLLDDGFQHEALARQADLVLWDLRDDPRTMRQLPAGRLREGLAALSRASAVILTRAECLPAEGREATIARVIAELKRRAPSVPVFQAASRLAGFRALRPLKSGAAVFGEGRPVEELDGRRVVLLSGLARPEGFQSMVVAAGAEVVEHLVYPDHAVYTPADLDRLIGVVGETGAAMVLTTEKDAVKLESLGRDLPGVYAAGLEMTLEEPVRWNAFLDDLLARRMGLNGK